MALLAGAERNLEQMRKGRSGPREEKMAKRDEPKVVKKVVAIHPLLDKYVRMTWSMLIGDGYDATYSSALNMMLLIAALETTKPKGLGKNTLETIWGFMSDPEAVEKLNLEDHLTQLRELYKRIGD